MDIAGYKYKRESRNEQRFASWLAKSLSQTQQKTQNQVHDLSGVLMEGISYQSQYVNAFFPFFFIFRLSLNLSLSVSFNINPPPLSKPYRFSMFCCIS